MRTARFLSLFLGLMVLFDGTRSPAVAEPLHPVRLVYFWPVQGFLLIPIVVAQAQGLYRARGLDVSIVLPPDAQTTARMLATGQAEIGMESRTDVIFAANISLPLTAIAGFDQHNSWCVVGRPGQAIDLGHLRGKTIGVFTDSWTAVMMHLLFARNGITNPDDVQQIITQFEDLPLLLAGRLDLATNVAPFSVADSIAETGRMPSLACRDRTGVPDLPIWAYTASPRWLAAHGDDARAFLAATHDATAWSISHPDEAAALFARTYPMVDSPLYDRVGWHTTIPYLGALPELLQQSAVSWAALAGAMHDIGVIDHVRDPKTYFTNAYLPR
ncbi:ABC transporter substrate-binding protein [Tanticharoenia sakaeratensis]|uniref:NMT1/THI5 like domain-containing protein n=1 Tax=Tanticharoenia sakaeratensis NBRC 103193 TaxID=1231623 RepID=A0A0D6MKJ7_9PROT|nr:ABC transporter substrate-binding protein [Tanticharoenia sakaeratensis]GAN54204.1 NMT1/THI5 like domain-containing protein [Tanticharoenia sakaeratensis NBRC 103193]GBQ19290.1 hypothetical protein AA103193_0978 [Tanticharoenia sakaeratensis NBRC 103193]